MTRVAVSLVFTLVGTAFANPPFRRVTDCSVLTNLLGSELSHSRIDEEYHTRLIMAFRGKSPQFKMSFGHYAVENGNSDESLRTFSLERMAESKMPVVQFGFARTVRVTGTPGDLQGKYTGVLNDGLDQITVEAEACVREAMRRDPNAETLVYFDLTGFSTAPRDGKAFPNSSYTAAEAYMLLVNPDLFARTEWYRDGVRLQTAEVIQLFQPVIPPERLRR